MHTGTRSKQITKEEADQLRGYGLGMLTWKDDRAWSQEGAMGWVNHLRGHMGDEVTSYVDGSALEGTRGFMVA